MRQQGFTLIELITVIVLLAVLSAVSIPSFQSTILRNRMTTEINGLVGDLHFARTEAIKRSRNITICSANSDFSDCSESPNWGAGGWIVLDDTIVLRVHEPIDDSDVLTEIGASGLSGEVVFNRYGSTVGGARSFRLCGPYSKASNAKGIVLTHTGRIRNAADTDDNGILESIDFSSTSTNTVELSVSSVDFTC